MSYAGCACDVRCFDVCGALIVHVLRVRRAFVVRTWFVPLYVLRTRIVRVLYVGLFVGCTRFARAVCVRCSYIVRVLCVHAYARCSLHVRYIVC